MTFNPNAANMIKFEDLNAFLAQNMSANNLSFNREQNQKSMQTLKDYETQLKSRNLNYQFKTNISVAQQLNLQQSTAITLPGSKMDAENNLSHFLSLFAEGDLILWIIHSQKLKFYVSKDSKRLDMLSEIVDRVNLETELGCFLIHIQENMTEILFRSPIHSSSASNPADLKDLIWSTMVKIDQTYKSTAVRLLKLINAKGIKQIKDNASVPSALTLNVRKGTLNIIKKKLIKFLDTNEIMVRKTASESEEKFSFVLKMAHQVPANSAPCELNLKKHALCFRIYMHQQSRAVRVKSGFTNTLTAEERRMQIALIRWANEINTTLKSGKVVVSSKSYFVYYELSLDYHVVARRAWYYHIESLVSEGCHMYRKVFPKLARVYGIDTGEETLDPVSIIKPCQPISNQVEIGMIKKRLISDLSQNPDYQQVFAVLIEQYYNAIPVLRPDILTKVTYASEVREAAEKIIKRAVVQYAVSNEQLNKNYHKRLKALIAREFFATYGIVKVTDTGEFYIVRESPDNMITLYQWIVDFNPSMKVRKQIYENIIFFLRKIHSLDIFHHYLHIGGIYVSETNDIIQLKMCDPYHLQFDPEHWLTNPQLFKTYKSPKTKSAVSKASKEIEAWGLINIASYLLTGIDQTRQTKELDKVGVAKFYARKSTAKIASPEEIEFLQLHRGRQSGNRFTYAVGLADLFRERINETEIV